MPDAARYHRLQLVLAAAGLALSTAYLLAALLTGAAHALAGAAATATDSAWGQIAIVAGVLAGAHALLTFPLAWTRGGGCRDATASSIRVSAAGSPIAPRPRSWRAPSGSRRSRWSTRSSARRPSGGSGRRSCSSSRT